MLFRMYYLSARKMMIVSVMCLWCVVGVFAFLKATSSVIFIAFLWYMSVFVVKNVLCIGCCFLLYCDDVGLCSVCQLFKLFVFVFDAFVQCVCLIILFFVVACCYLDGVSWMCVGCLCWCCIEVLYMYTSTNLHMLRYCAHLCWVWVWPDIAV